LPRRCCDEGDGVGRADDDGAGEAMSPATWARGRDGHYFADNKNAAAAGEREPARRRTEKARPRRKPGRTHRDARSLVYDGRAPATRTHWPTHSWRPARKPEPRAPRTAAMC